MVILNRCVCYLNTKLRCQYYKKCKKCFELYNVNILAKNNRMNVMRDNISASFMLIN